MNNINLPPEAHGVKIVDDFEESLNTSLSKDEFTRRARSEKEEWLAYKNSGLAKLGKGKRRSCFS